MSFIARNSVRTIARTPRVRVNARSRAFTTTSEATTSEATAFEKYVAEEKALQHHAAGKYTITYSLNYRLSIVQRLLTFGERLGASCVVINK
jgi:hypothetical protein